MRWLQNRYGKRKDLTHYRPGHDYGERWLKWPKHMTVLRPADAAYITAKGPKTGDMVALNSSLCLTYHPSFVWYRDGDHAIALTGILFPDGTEWIPELDISA